MNPLPQGHDLYEVWQASTGEAFAVGRYGTALVNKGSKWEGLDCGITTNLHDVWGSGKGNVWGVGDSGYTVWTDGSTCINAKPTTKRLNAIWGHSAKAVYTAGEGGAMYFSGGGGGAILHRKSTP